MIRKLKVGSTSQTIEIVALDSTSTTGGGLTGITYNASGLTAYYHRQGANASVAITLASGTLGTWSSGGWSEVDSTHMPGVYEVGIPDAALASGAKYVTIVIRGATNMVGSRLFIELDAVDYQDAVHFGLSALPGASAGANGGLPTVDASNAVKLQSGTSANQISLSSGAVLLQPVQTGVTIPTVTTLTNAPSDTSGTTTLLSRLSSTRAGLLDNLDAAITTRLATSGYTAPPTAAQNATALWQDLTSGSDFTTVGSIGKLLVTDIDATISSRSSYAGGDTSGTTTLLSRLTSTRAGLLDNLDAAVSTRLATSGYTAPDSAATITTTLLTNLLTSTDFNTAASFGKLIKDNLNATVSSRSTYDGSDTSGTTTLLSRLSAGRATNLDNLDAQVSTRLATSGYTVPPTAAAIATAVLTDTGDNTTLSSPGKILAQLGGAFTDTASSVYSVASLANAPAGGGGGGASTASIWQDLLSSGDFQTPNSIGNLLANLTTTVLEANVVQVLGATAEPGPLAPTLAQITAAILGVGGNPIVADSTGRVTLAPAGLDPVTIETGINARQALSGILAAAGGLLSGMGTGTIIISAAGISPIVTRLTVTVDSSGNRTGVTLSLPA